MASDEDDQIVVGRIRGGGVIESNINNIRFANRFKELIECEYNVQPALETLVVHDEKRKAGQ